MKRQILMFSVLMMTLGSHAVNVSIKMNSVSTSMILVEKSTADTIHVDAPDKSFTYQLDLEPATYTLTGVNKNGTTLQGTMELTVTDEAEQSFIIWTVQTIKATNSGWVYGEDYTIEELSCRTREGMTIPVTLGDGTAAGTKACLILNGGSFNCTLRPSAAHQAEGYVDAYASATVTGNTSSSSAIPMSGMFTVDFPADAHCMVFRKLGGTLGSGSIHYVPFVPITPADSVSGRQTFRLAEGGTYSYRLWKEGKRTKAGTFVFYQGPAYDGKMWDETCDGFNHIVFTDDDLSESSKYFNHSTADNNKSNVANILLNINERGHLRMKSGQTKNLLAQRDWQLTNSQTANYFIEPDYHYTVLGMDGNPESDIISIDNADTSISPWATLHANKAGSAIVLVTYDAMHLTQWARSGSGNDKKPYTMKESDFCFGADWSACWGENTGVFVVTVDDSETTVQPNMTINQAYNAETMKNAGKYVDAEHDCFYYLQGEDGYHYTFAPDGAASVAIAYPQLTDITASYSGFTPVEANADGSYTLTLKHGRQIVRITGNDGGIVYQVLTAKQCTRTISNLTHDDGKFYPGDQIAIQYNGLFHPANKMSGIYNMSAYITYNGVPTGTELILGSNQYAFGGTPKAQCVTTTIPDTWQPGTPFTLDDGVIQVTGFGDPIGNHRYIDKVAGRSPNFTAIAHKTYFGAIPDVNIEVSWPEAYSRDVTEGEFGTICLPFDVSFGDAAGARFYTVAGKTVSADGTPQAIVLDEVDKLAAGIPYIFQATDSKLTCKFTGSAVEEAGNAGGLYGTFADATAVACGKYVIYNNTVKMCGSDCTVDAFRAYIDMDDVEVATGAGAASIRVNDATGISLLTEESDGEFYDLQGRRVAQPQRGIYLVKGQKVIVK